MSYVILNENCLDALKNIADNSIDSIVTDPPYGLNSNDNVAETITRWIQGERDFIPDGKGFMGKSWDAFVPPPAVWDECLRVLKPGGHLLAFFGSRTQDIGALSIRLAGFEIRDSIAWLYSSGFPKSHNISKAMDRHLGAERKVVGTNPNVVRESKIEGGSDYGGFTKANADITVSMTPEAIEWEGWGTALKPSFEPIVMARKPLIGTVVENVLEYGTGGINIDGSRIGSGTGEVTQTSYPNITGDNYNQGNEEYPNRIIVDVKSQGRWPANTIFSHSEGCVQVGFAEETYTINKTEEWTGFGQIERPDYTSSEQTISTPIYECVDGCSVKELDTQSGVSRSSATKMAVPDIRSGKYGSEYGVRDDLDGTVRGFNDAGGASRFFYVSKASKKDRNEGDANNNHPTVKPTNLMRYLVKLVTPPNGVVLDPFTGSGSTGKAAILEGFDFIGIELTPEYIPIIETRLAHAESQMQKEDDLFD